MRKHPITPAPVQRVPVGRQMMKFLITQLTSPRWTAGASTTIYLHPNPGFMLITSVLGWILRNQAGRSCVVKRSTRTRWSDGSRDTRALLISRHTPDTAGVSIKKLIEITSSYTYSGELYSTEKRSWLCCRTQQEQITDTDIIKTPLMSCC